MSPIYDNDLARQAISFSPHPSPLLTSQLILSTWHPQHSYVSLCPDSAPSHEIHVNVPVSLSKDKDVSIIEGLTLKCCNLLTKHERKRKDKYIVALVQGNILPQCLSFLPLTIWA